MLATAVAYLLTPRSVSIYEKQVMARSDSPAHEGEFVSDVLERLHVRDILPDHRPLVVFQPSTTLREILEVMTHDTQQTVPIVGKDGALCGVIDFQDIRVFLTEHTMPVGLVVADDLRAATFRTVMPNDDLASVLHKFQAVGLEELPVVESESSAKVVGILSRRELVAAYHDRMYASKGAGGA